MRRLTPYVFFVITIMLLSFGCHKEVARDENVPQIERQDTIPPGHAKLTGSILEIESVKNNDSSSGPCSKTPCIAKVKIESIEYGAGFPVLSSKKIRIKFAYTLSPTTKDLFPNMDESFPGLKVGDRFSALAALQESMNDAEPHFIVYGYSIINN